MKRIEFLNETCLYCNHFGFCMVNWGLKCKRQGGKKIPRLKSRSFKERQKEDHKISNRPDRSRHINNRVNEPIRTKAVNW